MIKILGVGMVKKWQWPFSSRDPKIYCILRMNIWTELNMGMLISHSLSIKYQGSTSYVLLVFVLFALICRLIWVHLRQRPVHSNFAVSQRSWISHFALPSSLIREWVTLSNLDNYGVCNAIYITQIYFDCFEEITLTLWWRRLLSYRSQSIDLLYKSRHWFLYDRNLHHEIVKQWKYGVHCCHFQLLKYGIAL